MENIFFWSQWPKQGIGRGMLPVYLFFLLLFFSSIIYGLVAWWSGESWVVSWYTQGDLKSYQSVFSSFEKVFFEFTTQVDNYAITEKFKATDLRISTLQARLYLGILAVGMVLLLTVATYFSGFWFALSASLFILLLTFLNLELLGIYGRIDKAPLVVALLAYIPLSYFYKDFGSRVSFLMRFISLMLITVVLLGIAYTQNGVRYPELYMATYAYAVPIIVFIVFCLINAHEIMSGIVYLVSGSSGKSHVHFGVFSGIYLLNLLYLYLFNIGLINFDLYHANAFVVYFISVLLGVWGFMRKEAVYGRTVALAPYGGLLYLALGIVSNGSLIYAFATDNTPAIEVFEDIILFTDIAIGFIFFAYVLVNFSVLLQQGKAVHKVLYQGKKFEYLWVYALGAIIMFLMLTRSDYFQYRQSLAGYYNNLGDLYRMEGNLKLSEDYYKMALSYDVQNHRSNYALGSLARLQGDEAIAYLHFSRALVKSPSPYDYANLSELVLNNSGSVLEAIFQLREGIRKFPRSGELLNNLGLLYSTYNIADSAFYYFEQARRFSKWAQVPEGNFYAAALQFGYQGNPDSLRAMLKPGTEVNLLANEIALYNTTYTPYRSGLKANLIKNGDVLDTYSLCYLYNFGLNKSAQRDTSHWEYIRRAAANPQNEQFAPFLQLLMAKQHLAAGNFGTATRILEALHESAPGDSPYYSNMLGNLYMQIEQYKDAAAYFDVSRQRGDADAMLNEAIALTEQPRQRTRAIELWQRIGSTANPEWQMIATDMLGLIHPDSLAKRPVNAGDDLYKFRILHYNQHILTDDAFNEVFRNIAEGTLQARAAVERLAYYLSVQNLEKASRLREEITGLGMPASLINDLKFQDLRLLYLQGRYQDMGALLEEQTFDDYRQAWYYFFKAVYKSHAGQALEAETLFLKALSRLPRTEWFSIELARHYNSTKQPEKAYNQLVEALDSYPDYHEYPPDLYAAYIAQCLQMRYTAFAESAYEKWLDIASDAQIKAFEPRYRAMQEEIAKELEGWE